MLNFFARKPELELLGCSDGVVTFRSSREVALGELAGEFRVADLGRLAMRVAVVRRVEPGRYQGKLLSPLEAGPHLEALLERRAPRVESSFRVISPDLPGYKALASDLSLSGVGLTGLQGPLEVGKRLHLKLELDSFREPVRVEAVVRWCSSGRAGLSFGPLGVLARRELEEYLGEVLSVERGVVPSSLSA